jgi:hypothetical protein
MLGSTSVNSRDGWLEYRETHLVLHSKFVEKIFRCKWWSITAVKSHANGTKHKQGELF